MVELEKIQAGFTEEKNILNVHIPGSWH